MSATATLMDGYPDDSWRTTDDDALALHSLVPKIWTPEEEKALLEEIASDKDKSSRIAPLIGHDALKASIINKGNQPQDTMDLFQDGHFRRFGSISLN
jgi:hypothetical protein